MYEGSYDLASSTAIDNVVSEVVRAGIGADANRYSRTDKSFKIEPSINLGAGGITLSISVEKKNITEMNTSYRIN